MEMGVPCETIIVKMSGFEFVPVQDLSQPMSKKGVYGGIDLQPEDGDGTHCSQGSKS